MLTTVAAAVGVVPSDAQSPTPTASPATFEPPDLEPLLQAVHCELTTRCNRIEVTFKPAAQMPSYDPVVHYAGLDSDPRIGIVWISSAAGGTPPSSFVDAIILGCMDNGEAGQKWKDFYDAAAAADAKLPSNAPDPYLNRHKLAEIINSMLKQQ